MWNGEKGRGGKLKSSSNVWEKRYRHISQSKPGLHDTIPEKTHKMGFKK